MISSYILVFKDPNLQITQSLAATSSAVGRLGS